MDFKTMPIQKILLILFVLVISMGIGWYSEKAVEKFIAINKIETL